LNFDEEYLLKYKLNILADKTDVLVYIWCWIYGLFVDSKII